MPPPLFTVETETCEQTKATVNLLPCRIHHDGDVTPAETFWNPTKTPDGTQTAYMRGRKLQGKTVKLPEGYHGTIVEKTEPKPDSNNSSIDEEEPQVGAMRGKATFDELVIWGHESTADAGADPHVRGIEEWIAFAEDIHSVGT
ncbi:ribonuclease H2, subunit C [Poronia punctata]|nr:ribonuclease H2, subunit C [Poronia punctata]